MGTEIGDQVTMGRSGSSDRGARDGTGHVLLFGFRCRCQRTGAIDLRAREIKPDTRPRQTDGPD